MRDFPTKKTSRWYLHYTCQSVDKAKLEKSKIDMIGDTFGIEAREVLLVPENTLEKHWYKPKSEADAQSLIETLLRKIWL